MGQEQRCLPRLLCNDHFSECAILIEGKTYIAQSINFNAKGLAVFTQRPLPDVEEARASFIYQQEDNEIHIDNIKIRIVYASDLDVGCRYGISFELDEAQDAHLLQRLVDIEQALQQGHANGDRYGLFQ